MSSVQLISVLCLFSLIAAAFGHVFRLGDCPHVDVQKDFEMKKFIGHWYVVQKFRTSSNCMRENVHQNGSDYYITEELEPVGVALSQKGKVSFVDGEPSSVMKVEYPFSSPLGKQNYWVVMTDYEQYAAVWSCQRILFGHRESAQIMSRTTDLPREVLNKIRKRFEGFGVNEHYFSLIENSKCGWKDNEKKTEKEVETSTGR